MNRVVTSCMIKSIHGRLGDVVFVFRNGRQHVRPYVKPRNPDTPAQRVCRSAFADAVSAWRALPVEEKEILNKEAQRLKHSGYNLFISRFMRAVTPGPVSAAGSCSAAHEKPVYICVIRPTERPLPLIVFKSCLSIMMHPANRASPAGMAA